MSATDNVDLFMPPAPARKLRTVLRYRPTIIVLRVLIGLLFLGLWQYASGHWIDPFFISAPDAVFRKLLQWILNGSLVFHLSFTLTATAVGFVIGALSGFVVGFVLGRSPIIADIFEPYITAVYSIPKIALAPLFIMWFGIGIESKIAMSAMVVFFLVFLNSFSGVREVSALQINSLRIMGANELQVLRYVVIPSATSWVLAGLKVSVPYALIGVVVGEMFSSNRGIGFLIAQGAGLLDTPAVFASVIVLALTGAVINNALRHLETYLLRWKGEAR
jgi:NitT/TauT family transport system permease protein